MIVRWTCVVLYICMNNCCICLHVWMAPGKISFKLTGSPSLNKVFELNLNWIESIKGFLSLLCCYVIAVYNIPSFTEIHNTRELDVQGSQSIVYRSWCCKRRRSGGNNIVTVKLSVHVSLNWFYIWGGEYLILLNNFSLFLLKQFSRAFEM